MRGDVLVGDDRRARLRKQPGDAGAGALDQPLADHDLIGARPEFDMHLGRRRGARRMIAREAGKRDEDLFDRRLVRPFMRFDREIGERIGRAAFVEQTPQGALGVRRLQERAV